MAIHPGDDLAGYRVTRLLGRGGMGEVWAAVDERQGRDVAIKVLLARAAMKPDLVRRFEREAKIAASIQSPYVCQLLDVATNKDGAHLLVFEHLTGESLADRLKREQYLPLSEVGLIIDDVLQGLAAAHAAGVIHRDLKPGNIFLEHVGEEERRERAKILDFGISKISGKKKEEPTLTAFDATLGSFAYMAPEQVRGAARADERADIYAVGAVAFRALSGRLPFEGTTAAVLVSLKLDRNPPSLEEATGEKWPAGVERFLERALARIRENRFSGALEALEAWRSIQPNHLTRHIPSPRSSTGQFNMPPVIQDDATEVDNPPTMTVDGTFSGHGALGSLGGSFAVSDPPAEVRRPEPSRAPPQRPPFATPGHGPLPAPPQRPDARHVQAQGYPAQGPPQQGRSQPGHPHPQPGHPQPGHRQPGQSQPGYPQPGHRQPGQSQPGHPQPGHPQPGHPQPGHRQPGQSQQGHPQQGHPQQGHPQQGHPQQGHSQQGHPQQGHPQPGHPQPGHPQQRHPQPGPPQPGHPQPQRGLPNPPRIPAAPRIPAPRPQPGAPPGQPAANPRAAHHPPMAPPRSRPADTPPAGEGERDSDPSGRRRSGRTQGGR